jgi:D-alanine transfer protein
VWRYEAHFLDAIVPRNVPLKDEGLVIPRQLYARPDVLTLFGSSELLKDIPGRAADFFARYPTGFAVNPIGKPGTTSLMIAQKLGAAGASVRGRKVAIIVSPSFFFSNVINAKAYAGNFSELIAAECLFSPRLSWALRRDHALRMADFPETLATRPVLAFAVAHLRRNTPLDRALFLAATPIGFLQDAVIQLQDHARVVSYLFEHRHKLRLPERQAQKLDWPKLIADYAAKSEGSKPREKDLAFKKGFEGVDAEGGFVSGLAHHAEWPDLDLLLRTARELGAEPIVLGIPVNGPFFDQLGIGAAARRRYYEALDAACARWTVPIVDFRSYENDLKFFLDTHDHLSPKGWICFDQAMDNFYHDRAP